MVKKVTQMAGKRPIKRGEYITVPFGAGDHRALVTDVRLGRVYVRIAPDSDHPIDTFYRASELGAA